MLHQLSSTCSISFFPVARRSRARQFFTMSSTILTIIALTLPFALGSSTVTRKPLTAGYHRPYQSSNTGQKAWQHGHITNFTEIGDLSNLPSFWRPQTSAAESRNSIKWTQAVTPGKRIPELNGLMYVVSAEEENNIVSGVDLKSAREDILYGSFRYRVLNASNDINEYRFDWLPDRVDSFLNGELLNTMTQNVPRSPGTIHANRWSNEDSNRSGHSLQGVVNDTLVFVEAHFNVSMISSPRKSKIRGDQKSKTRSRVTSTTTQKFYKTGQIEIEVDDDKFPSAKMQLPFTYAVTGTATTHLGSCQPCGPTPAPEPRRLMERELYKVEGDADNLPAARITFPMPSEGKALTVSMMTDAVCVCRPATWSTSKTTSKPTTAPKTTSKASSTTAKKTTKKTSKTTAKAKTTRPPKTKSKTSSKTGTRTTLIVTTKRPGVPSTEDYTIEVDIDVSRLD
jgi:hypothetical protein